MTSTGSASGPGEEADLLVGLFFKALVCVRLSLRRSPFHPRLFIHVHILCFGFQGHCSPMKCFNSMPPSQGSCCGAAARAWSGCIQPNVEPRSPEHWRAALKLTFVCMHVHVRVLSYYCAADARATTRRPTAIRAATAPAIGAAHGRPTSCVFGTNWLYSTSCLYAHSPVSVNKSTGGGKVGSKLIGYPGSGNFRKRYGRLRRANNEQTNWYIFKT